jgi:mannosyltransferase
MTATSSPTRNEVRHVTTEDAGLLTTLRTWTAVLAITGLGAALQLHAITAKSFWLDEGSSITMSRLDWFNFLRILWRREMNMALYYLLLRGWLHLGDSVAWIRGLSVVFATAAIPAIFVLGRKMLGTSFGLVSALLLSVNAFQVRYAQEVRSYSLLVLLLIGSSYFFVSALENRRKRDWTWYIVASSLAVYAHFFAVLVVLAHWAAVRVMASTAGIAGAEEVRPEFRRAARLIALWTAPIWIFIATTGAGPIAWIRRPGLDDILGLLMKLSGNADTLQVIVYSAFVMLGLIAGSMAIRSRRSESPAYVILACWFFVPLLIVLLVSLARPVFAPRYFMIVLPAWLMLTAAGITAGRSQMLAAVLAIGVAGSSFVGVRNYYKADFDIGRNDVRSATTYILDHAQPHDGVVFYTLSTRFPYDYYAAHRNDGVKPDTLWPGNNSGVGWRDFMGVPAAARVSQFAQGRERIWLVTTPMPPNDPKFTAFESALKQQYRLTDTQDFPYVQVMLFSRQ